MIATEVQYLKTRPQASYAYCDYQLTGNMEGYWRAKPFNTEDLLKMNYITGVSVMKREHFPGFDPKIKGFQDWDMWLTMLENGYTGVHVPRVLFEAIQREDGISADVNRNWQDRVLAIYGKHKRVAIYTLTKDRLKYTKRMFAALERFTHRHYDHFVIDQGSKDGTVEYLKTRSLKKLILNKENTGISHGSNQALDAIHSDYDYIMKLDNDAEILTDNWLEEIVKLLVLSNGQGILSPYVEGIWLYEDPDRTGMPRSRFIQVNGHTIGLTTHLGGISVMAPWFAYKDFRFDENDTLSRQQDVSFSRHVTQNGYALGYCEDILIKHMDTTKGKEK